MADSPSQSRILCRGQVSSMLVVEPGNAATHAVYPIVVMQSMPGVNFYSYLVANR